MKSNTETEKILYISFNQDNKCFAVGTETGFRIYSTNPLKLTITRGIFFLLFFSSFRFGWRNWNNRNAL